MAGFEIKFGGIKDFQKYMERNAQVAEKAAALAINDMTRKVYARSKKKIMSSVNLNASYLDGRDGSEPRLKITKFAKPGTLSASIVGRNRATSLNRFDAKQLYAPAKGGGRKKAGVSVHVKRSRKIPKAFFVNLKAGNADGGNTGVAIRLPAGERIKGKKLPGKPLGSSSRDQDVYLLYGPSVEQLFRNQVANEGLKYVEDHLDDEFQRQFARLTSGR
jgi:hypothetical protein